METLQIALIVMGIVVVAAIIIINKWQESGHRSKVRRAFPEDNLRDPLLEREPENDSGGERREPMFGGGSSGKYGEEDEERGGGKARAESKAPAAVVAAGATYRPTQRPRAQPSLPDRLDTRVDCCIRIEAVEPIEVPRLWVAQAEAFSGLSRPLRWFAFDDRDNQWQRINANAMGAYHWFLAALQLVDREGVVSESDLLYYIRGMQQLADMCRAVPANLPSRAEVLGNARALDRFCAEVDVQIAINIVAAQPMPGTRIFSLAEAEGLRLEGDGAFHARANDSRTLYVLANGESMLFERSALSSMQTRRLSLVLDLPRVIDAAAEFEDMMRFATHLARALSAAVVDDNGQPFGPEAVDAVRARIRAYQTRMNEEGIPPGGSLARRLFGA
ncbi:MAG: ZipA [Azoarcus sp.]|jgi:FtsZ-interacting cell division protein ZipA|nr:ZipA [Azoarcus sp.]